MEELVPIIETDSTTSIEGIELWANGNVTPDSRNKLRLILDLYANSTNQEFANVSKRWDIDWFWTAEKSGSADDLLDKQKEFYALNLVNAETEQQLWSYS
jgi:hypothetical protein